MSRKGRCAAGLLAIAVAAGGTGIISWAAAGFGSNAAGEDGAAFDIHKTVDSGIVYGAESEDGGTDAAAAGPGSSYIFTDMAQTHWAAAAARAMTQSGVVRGYADGSFRPDGKLTYGEFIKMMCIYYTGTDIGNCGIGHWAQFYYNEAVRASLFTEEEIPKDKLSCPAAREAVALLTARTFGNRTLENIDEVLTGISDITSSHKYAHEIAKAYGFGILTGYEDGSFRPEGELTRAEGVTVMYRLTDETARVIPDSPKANESDGTDSGNSDGSGDSDTVPIGSVITKFMDYMPHPFYKVPVVYDESYAAKWEATGERKNPYANLKYCVILDESNTGSGKAYAGLSAALTKNLLGGEGITFSDEVLLRNAVLVCGTTAYRMESYNSKRYWLPDTDEASKLPKYEYVGFFQNDSDTLYLLKASKITRA